MLMICAHTYILHAAYMLYIQIHTHIYTLLKGLSAGLSAGLSLRPYICVCIIMYVYVLHVCNVIHANTYQYIQIHTHTYTYIHIHAMTWAGTLTHVRHAACRYTLDTCTYMHIYTNIHTYTYTYIYIQSVSCRGFGVLLLPHATPMRSATYPDQLGRGSGRGHRVPIVMGWPMGSAGGSLGTPYACSVHGCAKTGVGMGP